ncbi:High mobility group B protein 3 [Raphanus sativus]|nr:High mobility group B protein 3 [Raphanus sativus]
MLRPSATGKKKISFSGNPCPPHSLVIFFKSSPLQPRDDFRQTYKKEHPNNKSVAAVGKSGGEKWKSLSDSEKAPYVAKADKLEEGPKEDEESDDKSVSEVSEEEDADIRVMRRKTIRLRS